MTPPAFPLLTAREHADARRLVESQGLSCEPCDEVVGVYDGGRLVATGARAGYVLKLFAIDEGYQGGETLGQLITLLVERARGAGERALLVFTRPEHVSSFAACGFRPLALGRQAALLEYGAGLEAYLDAHRPLRRDGANGAVVVNGNPFTLGHLHLVETAARRAEWLYLFIVREDRSAFPFEARWRLAREGTSHLRNVLVLDTSRYSISAATFPSYFIRQADAAARAQMEVDAHLFGGRLAPAFSIQRRFVGDEPFCPATAEYNAVLASVLPQHGLALEVVQRIADGRGAISASRVRDALAAGDLEGARHLVPETTMAFLRSPEGAPIVESLRRTQRRGMQ
jgi:[citrate (pro-3S)-lyase] ligase